MLNSGVLRYATMDHRFGQTL